MTRPEFPAVLDSTLMSHFRACPRSAFLSSFEHWKPRTRSVHLHAGAAYARGLEVARLAYYGGIYTLLVDYETDDKGKKKPVWRSEQREPFIERASIEAGLHALIVAYGDFECPPDSAKSLERMMGAFEYYFTQYPMTSDAATPARLPGGLGVEFSFAEPIDIAHPETGDPLLYCGRFDMICDYAGQRFGEDDKTTSQLGASWSKQWDLRSQFTAYTWGARKASIVLDGFIIRGVSILKTKYDTQQAITYRPAWVVDRWYEQLLADVRRMIAAWESGYWDYNLDEACNAYGGCQFRKICMTEPARVDNWLPIDFERRRWDPITRTETLLES